MTDMTQTRITAEEYFQLPEYDEHDLIQLIDGEVIVGMPPVPKHQDIVREILVMFTLLSRKKGGKTYDSPIELYLNENNIYQPDVIYLAPDSNCTIGEKRLTGAPELVVEVLSPSTAKYDRSTKYSAYEKNGVQEYWIIDPSNETIEIWTQDDSEFIKQGVYDATDTFESSVLKETINVAEIFDVN